MQVYLSPLMAKVHPTSSSSSSSSLYSPLMSSERQVFTIWMKSLVLNGYGCTIYDSKGLVVYRMDNYDSKSSHEVFFMNSSGKTLFKILKKVYMSSYMLSLLLLLLANNHLVYPYPYRVFVSH